MSSDSQSIGIPDVEIFTNVHVALGTAMWQSQSLEDTLCAFIAIVLRIKPTDAEKEIRLLLDTLHSKTLGNLIAELRKFRSGTAVSTFEARLNRFLAERNWLVHSSWREHHSDLYHLDRSERLILRLRAIDEEATALRRIFGELVLDWMISSGFTHEEIEAEAKARLKGLGVPF